MIQFEQDANSTKEQPRCLYCGLPLEWKGRVADVGTYKKWVENWRCPVHGEIYPPVKTQLGLSR